MKTSRLPVLLLLFFATQINAQFSEGLSLSVKVYLQGALIDAPGNGELMRDDLRSKKMIPQSEPYTGMPRYEHVGPGGAEAIFDYGVLEKIGPEAIVDWVFIELRDAKESTKILATRSALLQRNGHVVDVDGESPVFFADEPKGKYHVAVRHRNHLGIMTKEPREFLAETIFINFSKEGSTYGNWAQVQLGDKFAMWAGDASNDGRFVMKGPDNDILHVFYRVLADSANSSNNSNHIVSGYYKEDINLDGQTIYSGLESDRGVMFSEVYGTAVQLFGAEDWPDGLFLEQLP